MFVSVLSLLLTAGLQLCGDLFFLLGRLDREIDVLFCDGLVGSNAVVIEVSNDGQVQDALLGADAGNGCCPFLIRTLSNEISVQQIGVFVQAFSILYVFFPPYDRQQIVLIHHVEKEPRIVRNTLSLKPNT